MRDGRLSKITPVGRQRALLWFWWVPGLVLSWILRSWLPWVTLMSWYAIVRTEQTVLEARIAQSKIDEQSDP